MNRHWLPLFLFAILLIVGIGACREQTGTAPAVPPESAATITPVSTRSPASPTATPHSPTVAVDGALDLDSHPAVAPFILHFSQPMAPGTGSPLSFTPEIAGEASWNETFTTLTFRPGEPFRPGRRYTVTLDETLTSAAGRPLAEAPQWRLRIRPAPSLAHRAPSEHTLTERRPAIELEFNRPMAEARVAVALSVSPDLAYDLAWEENVLQILPAEPLAFGTTYSFVLDRTATDRDGVPLSRAYEWSYRLRDVVQRLSGPSRSKPEQPVRIRFNYALEPERFEQVVALDPPLTGTFSWNEERTEVSFTPVGRLPAGREYTLTFGGPLHDAAGAILAVPAPLSFTTPPPILLNGPEGENVNPATTVRIRFDRPMDEAATAAAFRLEPEVPGEIVWEETTLVFRPESGYFDERTGYRVQLGLDAAGADGERVLDETFAWSFTTGPLRDVADFGWGPNAQVLDANGRRAVHFSAHSPSALLEFELYELALPQFLDRYASGFRGAAGWGQEEIPSISTEGTSLVASWSVESAGAGEGGGQSGPLQETIVPDTVPPGLYLLNLTAGHVNDQLILVLTENTLVVKQAGSQLVTWVTGINGEPLPGAAVEVYARSGRRLAQGTADGDGVYRITLPAYEAGGPPSLEPLIVVGRRGADLTVSGLSPEWGGEGWGGWWRPQPEAMDYAVYLYTERPIYRPGQTVYFKAIVRRDEDAVLSMLPAGTPLTARLRDARNNVVQTIPLETNDFGTVAGEFLLAEGAMLGNYHLEIEVAGETHRQAFKVEDYRKPEYEVVVSTATEQYVVGEEIEITVEARYFFGEPVANARVELSRFYVGENYGWADLPGDALWYQGGSLPGGRTDAHGRFTTTVRAEVSENYNSYWWASGLERTKWAFEATVAAEGNQSVSGSSTATVFDALEEVTLDTNGYVHAPGTAFSIEAEVRDIYGNAVGGRTLSVELLRWNRGSYDYDMVVQETTLTTEADGEGRVPFTIAEPGYYRLSAAGEDARGNEIEYTTWIYAFSGTVSSWYGREGTLAIDAERDSYAPGDSAQLLIESEFSGPALLTFERGTTRRERLIRLEAPLTVVEVPIEAEDAPNIHVTVNAWQEQDTTPTADTYGSIPDSRLQQASVNLSVPATRQRLQVALAPDQASYAPREEATITVQVTDHAGEPVVAELSLGLVDEAIYALSQELAGPIFDGFYFERENRVNTYDSLRPTRSLGGGLGGGGGGADIGNPRADFPDTAAWVPVVQTGANGEATVTVTLPDSLTTWRLTARATTVDTRVGEATAELLTHQEIVVRPLLPRILTTGDTVELSALVHNYGDEAVELAVSIREIGDLRLEIAGPLTQTIMLQPDAVRVVGWQAEAQTAGEVELLVAAQPVEGDWVGDAVQLSLPVQPLAVPDVETQIGQFTGSLETTVQIPADALPLSRVEIQLSRSIAGSLLNGLEYLTGFPYGCVEQTMSKALPNAVVGRAFNRLGVGNPTLQADLPPRINASLQRLYGYQHNDGGWGWWYDDPSHDYQTAWVVFGLAMTAEAGYEVDDGVIQRGALWLEQHLVGMDPRTQSFALYSLALSQEMAARAEATIAAVERESWEEAPATVDYERVRTEALALQEEPGRLDFFSRAALALALNELGEETAAQTVVDALVAEVTVDGGNAYWTGEDHDGYYYQKTMASDVRNTALALSALATVRPDPELQAQVVSWLMAQRRQQGWGTTNETSFAVVGLTDHLLATSFAGGGTQTGYRLLLNGNEIAAGQLGPGEPAVSLLIPREQLADGENELVLTQEGSGRLYYVISRRVYRAQAEVEAAGAFTVRRSYHDPGSGRLLQAITPQQLVEVRLTVTLPEEGSYMIVEDKLPGGLEALNERLNTTSHVAQLYGNEPDSYWQIYGYNHKEVFGDRVTFFITELDAGSHTFTYYARATRAGTFTAMPAEVYAMYNLAQWGRSASDRVEIRP